MSLIFFTTWDVNVCWADRNYDEEVSVCISVLSPINTSGEIESCFHDTSISNLVEMDISCNGENINPNW